MSLMVPARGFVVLPYTAVDDRGARDVAETSRRGVREMRARTGEKETYRNVGT